MSLTMKDEILKRFLQADGLPLSGQKLAEEFGISRTAVWKHLQSLQEEGYRFETEKKKGYVLVEVPDRVDPARISCFLNTERLGKNIYYLKQCTSTQKIAQKLVSEGAGDGTVVISECQTEGRGRMARKWESTEGKGIWMTVILRPTILPHQAPQFTLVAAVSVVNAMKSLYKNFLPAIKWPNDILINNRKCTGILTEMIAEVDQVQALLVGIGINVNQQKDDFPDEIKDIATSVSIEENKIVDRAQLAGQTLNYFEQYADLYLKKGFAPIKALWEEASNTIGKKVKAVTLTETIEGTAIGITEDGILEVQLANGEIKQIYSADIQLNG